MATTRSSSDQSLPDVRVSFRFPGPTMPSTQAGASQGPRSCPSRTLLALPGLEIATESSRVSRSQGGIGGIGERRHQDRLTRPSYQRPAKRPAAGRWKARGKSRQMASEGTQSSSSGIGGRFLVDRSAILDIGYVGAHAAQWSSPTPRAASSSSRRPLMALVTRSRICSHAAAMSAGGYVMPSASKLAASVPRAAPC